MMSSDPVPYPPACPRKGILEIGCGTLGSKQAGIGVGPAANARCRYCGPRVMDPELIDW